MRPDDIEGLGADARRIGRAMEISPSVKLEINNLIWMHGDERLTLQEAEKRALQILDLITNPPEHRA